MQKVLSEVIVLGSELSLSLLDCDHSYKKEDLLSAIRYASEHQDSDLAPSLGPLLTLSFVYDTAVLVPPSGSCGYLLKATPLIDEPTQVITVKFTLISPSKRLLAVPQTQEAIERKSNNSTKQYLTQMLLAIN